MQNILKKIKILKGFGAIILVVSIVSSCSTKVNLTKTETSQYRLTSTFIADDSLTAKEIEPFRKRITDELSQVISISNQPMEKSQPEGLLGNFASDACLKKAKEYFAKSDSRNVDFCFMNNGGLRVALPKGEITRKKVFELMPFENELVCLILTGEKTKKLLDFMASKGGMPVAGVRFKINGKEAEDISFSGKDFDIAKEYIVVTSDYLASGGDELGFLTSAEKIILNLKVRDGIIEYLLDEQKQNRSITVIKDGRVQNK